MGIVRRIVVGGVAGLALVGVAGCSDQVSAADAYRVGCPAVDAVAGGGELAGRAAVSGLQRLHESEVLGTEAQQWLGDALVVLGSGDPEAASAEVRARIADGCEANGYPITNLR